MPALSFDILPRDCWLSVKTAQLTDNLRILQKQVAKPALVVVKGNGYGHGYENAARAFVEGGAHMLGVATLSEGLFLRSVGITAPILIICGISASEMTPA